MWWIEHWYLMIALLVCIVTVILAIIRFLQLPADKQIANLKEWLLFAVIQAEKELGSGTGQLKLRQVYDWAVSKFPWVQFLPFDTFSGWVDEALNGMEEMLQTNGQIKSYVKQAKP
jgi:hypothetical protein